MRGYCAKKGKIWYAVVYLGVDPATGKERRMWERAGTRREDAENLVNKLVHRHNEGDEVAPEKVSLKTYLTERWLPIQQAQLRPSTYDSYRRNIDLHVIPAIGGIQLQKLTAEDLDAMYARLLYKGRRNGKKGGLSPKTVRNIHLMLHKALADAQRKGTVFRNVASLADAPKLSSHQRPAMRVWEAHELRHFLKVAESRRHYPAFFLAAHTGMRRGEVLGLRWNDVDLDARRLSVSRSVVSVGYDLQLSTPKTGTGRRTIDLDHRTVNVLRAWKETQATERTIPSADANPWGDLTFSRPDGTPVHPDIFSQAFDRVVASTELPVISFHDLRHTHASLLLKAGVPVKVVSERLGHANPAFTMNVYQHVIPGMQAQAANTFSQLLHATEDHVEDGGEERA